MEERVKQGNLCMKWAFCSSEDLPQADTKCLAHSKVPPSIFTNQLVTGRVERVEAAEAMW